MALRAHEFRILLALIDLVIQYPTIITRGGDVASFRAAAGLHSNFQCLNLNRIHCRVMAFGATQIRMHLVTKSSR